MNPEDTKERMPCHWFVEVIVEGQSGPICFSIESRLLQAEFDQRTVQMCPP